MDDSTTATLTLRRWNSIATSVVLPKQLTLPAAPPSSSSLLDLDLVSLRSSSLVSYTSLKDLLPSSTSPSVSGCDISIRNRLVKHAAWAYLQPMSASPTSPPASCFLRHFAPCLNFFYHRLIQGITWIFHRIFRAISGHVTS